MIVFLFLAIVSSGAWGKTHIWVGKIRGIEVLPPRIAEGVRKNTLLLSAKVPESELHLIKKAGTIPDNGVEIVNEFLKVPRGWRVLVKLRQYGRVKREEKFEDVSENDILRVHQGALERLLLEIPVDRPMLAPPQTSVPAPLPSGPVINDPPPSVINFKKRISELQGVADSSFVKKIEEEKPLREVKKQTNPVMPPPPSVEPRVAKSSTVFPETFHFERSLPLRTSFSFLYRQDSIATKSEISTEARPAFFGLNIAGEAYRHSESVSLVYDVTMSRPIKADVPTPQLFKLGIGEGFHWSGWYVFAKGVREDELFYNVQEQGSGIAAGVITAMWGEFSVWKQIDRFKKPWLIGASYSTLVSGSTSWTGLQSFTGSKLSAAIGSEALWESTAWSIIFEDTQLSGRGSIPFQSQNSRFNLRFSYVF